MMKKFNLASMVKKKITGTVVITEVDDDDEENIVNSSSSSSGSARDEADGQARTQTEGKTEKDLTQEQEKQAKVEHGHGPSLKYCLMYSKWAHLSYLILLAVLLGLVVPYLLASFAFHGPTVGGRGSCALNISYRFECLPGAVPVPSEAECHSLACCYDAYKGGDLYAPMCFHSIPSEYVYLTTNTTNTTTPNTRSNPGVPKVTPRGESRSSRVAYRLSEVGEISLALEPLRKSTPFGTDAWSLSAKVQYEGSDVVRVLIYSPEHDYLFDDFPAQDVKTHQLDVVVTEDSEGDFNITVTRVATGEDILETVFGPMIYGRDYAEITMRIPTKHLYGMGTRRNFDFTPNFSQRERWALYNQEKHRTEGNSTSASGNSGAHPFFMNFERTSGYMYGVYLQSSAPVEVGVLPIPAVVFRGVGIVWDLRVMAGPEPRDVTRQYAQMVGMPAMPPYWAFGYHMCRATGNLSIYDQVANATEEALFPYESDCIDARLNYPHSFAPLPNEVLQRVSDMKSKGRKFTLAQYPFVTYNSEAYNSSGNFLMKINDSLPYYGLIEDQAVGYPDYTNEDTLALWLSGSASIQELYKQADGVFLLHNTPLNEAILNYTAWNGGLSCSPAKPGSCCPNASLPFVPLGLRDVNNHTLCAALRHPSHQDSPHLYLHNAYGYYHHKRIHGLMQNAKPKTRSFVTSQSTHPGSGAFGGAFGERFGANFVQQKMALLQVLEMGLYGMPLAGLPICGSTNNTIDEEVKAESCLRGHQMAAFWPLMVSHYEYGYQARNPTDFDVSFVTELTLFVRMRYSLLPYYYTLMYEASQEATPLVRPLFYEFPEDQGSREVSTQFMVGGGILVSPILQTMGDKDSIEAHIRFPPGCWYDFYTGALLSSGSNGTNLVIPTLLADALVHMRGGAIVPLQGNLHDVIRTTSDSRKTPFTLIVALCDDNATSPIEGEGGGVEAKGSLYVDDGMTPLDPGLDPYADRLDMTSTREQLTVTRLAPSGGGGDGFCSFSNLTSFSTQIDQVKVYGAPDRVNLKKVTVNGKACIDCSQDGDTNALTIPNVNFDWCLLDGPLVVTWGTTLP